MSANTHQHTTSAKVLTAIHNIPRRVRSGTLRAPRAAGKENDPGAPSKFAALPPIPEPRAEPARWAPAADGRIVLKVWVPTTDEVWKVRVPAGTGLAAFRARVEAKLGFAVCFSAVRAGILRSVVDEGAFREWVRERVVDGRNTLLTAHRLELQ
ncbi:uncharacterized protein BXZ73DRAFT_42086 [Epithele typhae]|uniref:uncharacterized protein n=1 Tax=Epithele typhae TaxID=378194 RepID=UPI0020088A8F|nr:uncharacterized protein BXZ73DRAFT_42086 [Epithele typhae]KAH9941240.1 hypothetical protein BXZ73DRAFT_42086 [Epithele typhae]